MEEKKVTWLELFYDLLFVAAVTVATHVLLHVEDGHIHAEYLVKFVLIFIPIWWAWVGQIIFVNRFGKDLFHQRIFDLANVFVLIMTSSLSADFDPYYLSFNWLYWLKGRDCNSISCGPAYRRGARKATLFLGRYFWIGIAISLLSVFLILGFDMLCYILGFLSILLYHCLEESV